MIYQKKLPWLELLLSLGFFHECIVAGAGSSTEISGKRPPSAAKPLGGSPVRKSSDSKDEKLITASQSLFGYNANANGFNGGSSFQGSNNGLYSGGYSPAFGGAATGGNNFGQGNSGFGGGLGSGSLGFGGPSSSGFGGPSSSGFGGPSTSGFGGPSSSGFGGPSSSGFGGPSSSGFGGPSTSGFGGPSSSGFGGPSSSSFGQSSSGGFSPSGFSSGSRFQQPNQFGVNGAGFNTGYFNSPQSSNNGLGFGGGNQGQPLYSGGFGGSQSGIFQNNPGYFGGRGGNESPYNSIYGSSGGQFGQGFAQNPFNGGQGSQPGIYNPTGILGSHQQGSSSSDRNLGFVNQAFGNPLYNRSPPIGSGVQQGLGAVQVGTGLDVSRVNGGGGSNIRGGFAAAGAPPGFFSSGSFNQQPGQQFSPSQPGLGGYFGMNPGGGFRQGFGGGSQFDYPNRGFPLRSGGVGGGSSVSGLGSGINSSAPTRNGSSSRIQGASGGGLSRFYSLDRGTPSSTGSLRDRGDRIHRFTSSDETK